MLFLFSIIIMHIIIIIIIIYLLPSWVELLSQTISMGMN